MLTTVQDAGRAGLAHLGVPRSGAVDAPSLRVANRLVGNPETAAALETTVTGVTVRPSTDCTAAVTGAMCAVTVDGRPVNWGLAQRIRAGQMFDAGPALSGLRSYVAITGGIDVDAVLGSRSTDLLSGLGPAPLRTGQVLPLGDVFDDPAAVDVAPYRQVGAAVSLRVAPGPRQDWLPASQWRRLPSLEFTVSPVSNRIGLSLVGPALEPGRGDELLSEGVVLGAVQVPGSGQPLVFLADHPTTGGYPVVGVVVAQDLPVCGQAAPGTRVRLLPV